MVENMPDVWKTTLGNMISIMPLIIQFESTEQQVVACLYLIVLCSLSELSDEYGEVKYGEVKIISHLN